MIATISQQPFFLKVKVNKARVSFAQDIDANSVSVNLAFLATHWVNQEGVEVQMSEVIIVDEKTHTIPLDLWILLRKSVSDSELIPIINQYLLGFNSEFYGSMTGFDFQIDNIELG